MYYYSEEDKLFDQNGKMIVIVDGPSSNSSSNNNVSSNGTTVSSKGKESSGKSSKRRSNSSGKYNRAYFERNPFPSEFELNATEEEIIARGNGLWKVEKTSKGAKARHSIATVVQRKNFQQFLLDRSRDGVFYGSVGDLKTRKYDGQMYYDKVSFLFSCLSALLD
jgi:hypothetical protein